MADTTVNSFVQTSSDPRQSPWGPYWANPEVGAIPFCTSASQPTIHVMRTTDKGATWSDITLGGGNVSQMAAWYDKETPGDKGDLLHVLWFNNNNNSIEYCSINVLDGTVGTVRTIESGLSSSGFAGTRVAITKLLNGRIIVAYNTPSEFECKKSAETSAPYFAAAVTDIANVLESASANDHLLLYPADVDDGDAAAIFWDRSADQLSVKMYDDSENDWTESTFGGTMVDDNFWPQMDGAIRHSDKKLLFAAHSDADDGGDNLLTWEIAFDSIASPTITTKGNIFTGQGESAQVTVWINQQSNEVRISYLKGGTWTATVDVVFHISSNGMTAWGSEQAYSEATADDIRRVTAGRSVGDDGGRHQPVFFNDDLNDLFINEVNDTEIVAAVGGTTFFQTISATGGSTATLDTIETTLQTIAAAAGSTATIVKAIITAQILDATAGSTATIVKVALYFRTLAVTEITVATIAKVFTHFETLTSTAGSTATLAAAELTIKVLSATETAIATIGRVTSHFRTLAATAASTATLATVVTFARTLSVIESSIVTLLRVTTHFKILSATETSVATLTKAITTLKTLAATEVSVATLGAVQLILKTLSATAGSVLTLSTAFIKVITLSAIEISVLTLQTVFTAFRTLAATAGSTATIAKVSSYFRTLSVTEVSVPSLSTAANYFRTLSVSLVSVVTLNAKQLILKVLTATEISIPSLNTIKIFSKTLSVVLISISSIATAVTTGVITISGKAPTILVILRKAGTLFSNRKGTNLKSR